MSTCSHRLERSLPAVVTAAVLAACSGVGPEVVASPLPPAQTVISEIAEPGPGHQLGDGVERRLLDGTRLEPDISYRASGELQDIDIVLRGSTPPLYAVVSPHQLGLSTEHQRQRAVLATFPDAGLRTFPSPDVEAADLEGEPLGRITDDAPADLIAWLAARPFLSTTGVDEHLQLGPLTGRGFAYEVDELPASARACGPAPAPTCAPMLWASGITHHVEVGEKGHVIEVDVSGQAVIVLVTDGPETAAVLPSLHFELWPVPEQAGRAVRLPYFTRALEPGQRYYIDKVGEGVGLVTTAPASAVTASQRDDLAWFGDPEQPPLARHYSFVAVDAGTAAANDDPALDPYALVGPVGIVLWELQRFLHQLWPLPDDPTAWLAGQPYVNVLRPAHDEEIGGHPARVVDVRVRPGTAGIPCPDGAGTCAMPFTHATDAFPMVLSTEYTTRVVDVTVGDHHVLITADLGTPGEHLLDHLCAFEEGSQESCA